MSILVDNINEDNPEKNNKLIVKSKSVICPKCGENIKLKIDNYKISLYDCKNGHKIDNLSLNDFEKTQNINLCNIICNICKQKNKSNTFNNEFYKCYQCNINLCPLCKSIHNKNHSIIDYDNINYKCPNHNELYVKYCNKCKINICVMCENEHLEHDGVYLGQIMKNKKDLKLKLDELKNKIEIFNNNIKKIIEIINKVKENVNIYDNIITNMIENYEIKNRNYEILYNINILIDNKEIINDINKINNEKNFVNKFNDILLIYNKSLCDINKDNKDNSLKTDDLSNNNINNKNPENIKYYTEITKDSYGGDDLTNSFAVFNSINNILSLIYSTQNKSLIWYDLKSNKYLKEKEHYHNEYISNIRHYLDMKNKRDLVLSSSYKDNNMKILDLASFICIADIMKVNSVGYLNSSCFLNENYIISCNCNFDGKSEQIKIFNFNGKKIMNIYNSNEKSFFIDTFYDNKLLKTFIIVGNVNYIKSYDYINNKLYHKYYEIENDNSHSHFIINSNETIIKLIEKEQRNGHIRIWNFHSGDLLKKIYVFNGRIFSLCLWNDNHLFVGCQDKSIKLVELNSGKIIKSLSNHNDYVINIKKINHPIFGECLLSQGYGDDQIKLWI